MTFIVACIKIETNTRGKSPAYPLTMERLESSGDFHTVRFTISPLVLGPPELRLTFYKAQCTELNAVKRYEVHLEVNPQKGKDVNRSRLLI